MQATSLIEIPGNRKARIVGYQGGPGIRRRLEHMGIHAGDVVTILQYGALGGPVLIRVHGFQLALGRGIAAKIIVEEVE